METRTDPAEDVEAQLDQWNARLYELAAKVDEAGSEAKTVCRKGIDDLTAEHGMLQARLLELKSPGSVRLSTFWAGVRLERVRRRLQNTHEPAETNG